MSEGLPFRYILGSPFFRAYYAYFQKSAGQLGFAAIQDSESSQSTSISDIANVFLGV